MQDDDYDGWQRVTFLSAVSWAGAKTAYRWAPPLSGHEVSMDHGGMLVCHE